MLYYYWKVRIYKNDGHYWFGQIKTGQNLLEIDIIQDFYETLTGCKMLLEGMAEVPYTNCNEIGVAFNGLWKERS